ncbi:hypothetical protein TYRP_008400 [Tyrophagus putrescentiae]|nr:hypothetical protein TYRP_008400 [Tyrophagus putrescentiae]
MTRPEEFHSSQICGSGSSSSLSAAAVSGRQMQRPATSPERRKGREGSVVVVVAVVEMVKMMLMVVTAEPEQRGKRKGRA